jgi:deoxyadenosine/deoxycytidine kinase
MPIQYITIEGNIGSGKSTLVNILNTRYGNDKRVCFLQEPVNVWETITDENGTTILELYYKDQDTYSFSFQIMAYISRLSKLRKAISEGYDIIISERSLETDKNVFAKMIYNDSNISKIEFDIYLMMFKEFQEDIPKQQIIYLRTDPNIAMQRIEKRGRIGENIPIEYIKKCNMYHEKWLHYIQSHHNIMSIDANVDYIANPLIMESWINDIALMVGLL